MSHCKKKVANLLAEGAKTGKAKRKRKCLLINDNQIFPKEERAEMSKTMNRLIPVAFFPAWESRYYSNDLRHSSVAISAMINRCSNDFLHPVTSVS